MTQAALGAESFSTSSATELAPVAPSFSRSSMASASTSKTTQVCPSRIRRRTMFAPIRPRSTTPSCMGSSVDIVTFFFSFDVVGG